MVVGVFGELDGRFLDAIGECPVQVRTLPAHDGVAYRDDLLGRSDVVVLRLADQLRSWAVLVGALNGLLSGRLLSVCVLAQDTSAVEGFLSSTSEWGEESAAVRAFQDSGRLVIHAEDADPSDLRDQLASALESDPAFTR